MHETILHGKKYYSKEIPVPEGEIPDCVLVPGFDQLVLGYKDRERMIDKRHSRKLTNISGIIFPSVIVRNRMRARWKTENGIVMITPFEKLLKKDQKAIGRKVKEVFGRNTLIRYDYSLIAAEELFSPGQED